jgi:phosphoketolase
MAGTTAEPAGTPLSAPEPECIHAGWRAADHLSIGQIYLLGNP